MKKRNPIVVLLLSLVTLGIYDIYWLAVTKKELNQKTKVHTPTLWMIFAPPLIGTVVILITFLLRKPTVTNSAAIVGLHVSGGNILVIIVYILMILAVLPLSLYWFLKFSKAVNEYTSGRMSTGLSFVLLWLLHFIGVAVVQDSFNDTNDNVAMAGFNQPQPSNDILGQNGSVTGTFNQTQANQINPDDK